MFVPEKLYNCVFGLTQKRYLSALEFDVAYLAGLEYFT